jgi:uncharacterized membrane protein
VSAGREWLFRHLIAIPLGLAVANVGVDHFMRPEIFDAIVPSYLGWPRLWTLSSGALEVLLGLGIALPKTRALSARCFALLVILMSLANINMWWNDLEFNGMRLSATGHMLRMSAQLVLLFTLFWLSRPAREES